MSHALEQGHHILCWKWPLCQAYAFCCPHENWSNKCLYYSCIRNSVSQRSKEICNVMPLCKALTKLHLECCVQFWSLVLKKDQIGTGEEMSLLGRSKTDALSLETSCVFMWCQGTIVQGYLLCFF